MITAKLKGFLLFLLTALLLYSENATATHNRAGEITYVKLSTYTYSVKIVTYTKTSSPADRPELEFWWGDGSRDTIPRLSIDFNVGPDIQRNIYVDTHVYPGTGSYIMYFLDENRNANVINIPGSVNIPFYVQTQLIISPAFLTNSSPQLLQPPIDDGAVNRLFIHNPNAYDPDGDSLSYELVPCKGFGGSPIPTFFYPPASTSFTLDPITGDLIWDSPMQQGEFNVAMIIREWRNIPGIGLLNIGYVTRDMQITIYPPINDPPVFSTIIDTCVEAGNSITFTITATDLNFAIVNSETFDGIKGLTSGGPGSYLFPNGWSLRNVDGNTPTVNTAFVNEAWERREDFTGNILDSCAFSTSSYSPAATSNDFMWSPSIGPLPNDCELTWRAKSLDPSLLESYEVRIMTAGPPTGSTGIIGNQLSNSTLLFSTSAENDFWTSHTVPLYGYAGQTVYIGFRNTSFDKNLLLVDDFKITDLEKVTLSATGGPFVVASNPATFTSTPNPKTVTGDFTWNTNCAHVRKAPYTVVFKAEDNNAQIQLADLESMFITVVGPSPKNPTSAPLGSSLILNWDQSACTEAVGYHIYRRIGSYGFIPSYCETGVPAYTGYVRIGSVNGLGTTTFTDNNNGAGLAIAVQYCYMVTAFYPDGAESYASIEFCNRLNRDLPVITNVDVNSTDAATGQIYVAWGKPVDIDPTQMPGPYRYELQRADASGNFVTIATFTDLNDTTFNDNGLNTTAVQYRYRVQFWNDTPGNVFSAGFSQIAYSIYLSIGPGDEKNNLSWNVNVPWSNTQYVIYRENAPGVFDSIGFTSDVVYVDDSLINGQNYCYYVKSVGAYQDTGLVDPIINKSQIFCSTPVDNEPPCPPLIANGPNCPQLKDTISWQIDISCANDIASYQIYYAPAGSNSYTQVGTVPAGTFSYIYSADGSIAGCYYITATDSTGNESDSSNIVCTESCPDYVLPNIFTPDGNFINDIYHPILPYRDVKDVEMTIFNRWGDKIFETTDPDINWNGKRNNDGEESPDGVYFYVCKVNEIRLAGAVEQRILKGIIHLTRGPVSK